MENTNARICVSCKKERPNDEPEETRKFKLCTKCRISKRERMRDFHRKVKQTFQNGDRICGKCKKKRPDDEPEETRKLYQCIECRLYNIQYQKAVRSYIQRSCENGVRLCIKCGKERKNDEPESAQKFKACPSCRLYRRQKNKTSPKNIKESLNSGIRICSRCRKKRPDDEPEEDRNFKSCSACRRNDRQKKNEIRRTIKERSNSGTKLCLKCGKARPDDEPGEAKTLKLCPACVLHTSQGERVSIASHDIPSEAKAQVSSYANKEETHISYPLPTVDHLYNFDAHSKFPPSVEAPPNSDFVQTAPSVQYELNFPTWSAVGDNECTHLQISESGMSDLFPIYQDPEPTRLKTEEVSGPMKDPDNVDVSIPISDMEVISNKDDEDIEWAEEPCFHSIDFSDSRLSDITRSDPELRHEYRKCLENEGVMSFLERYIPDTMNKFDICKMIIDLGYPKESIEDYEHLTSTEAIQVLIELIRKDISQETDC
ncbi:SIR2 [[Candida] subhashii]|uniref:SIR2 n=1 Tax=[Candida] subhashii TaxID=561895 RepID=A0A8J5UJZ5_9ASCO|nr:SIR2 [[Candida] subhashii]KAG7661862.1 SIR2 [[Candida] subhashii]